MLFAVVVNGELSVIFQGIYQTHTNTTETWSDSLYRVSLMFPDLRIIQDVILRSGNIHEILCSCDPEIYRNIHEILYSCDPVIWEHPRDHVLV